ncbi:hypothetical protein V8G54_006133 [Vigna mungo]|uniref:Uncharacterized protein n=1 Tax=Vigna mungo TaxID=3915 RepID=A0AAQ3S7P8_VIGMU
MGWMKYVLAVFLSLSLLSVSMVRSQDVDDQCPINNTTGLITACNSLLYGEDSSSCCSRLQGLTPDQAGSCIINDIHSQISTVPPELEFYITGLTDITVNYCELNA